MYNIVQYRMEYCASTKKDEAMSFVATWVDQDNILSKTSPVKRRLAEPSHKGLSQKNIYSLLEVAKNF